MRGADLSEHWVWVRGYTCGSLRRDLGSCPQLNHMLLLGEGEGANRSMSSQRCRKLEDMVKLKTGLGLAVALIHEPAGAEVVVRRVLSKTESP